MLDKEPAANQLPEVPVGTIMMYAGPISKVKSPKGEFGTTIDDLKEQGWLIANGGELNKIEYPDLFAVIGTTYGSGQETDKFKLPDLRGIFVRGLDEGRGKDDEGRKLGQYQEDAFKNHYHSFGASHSTKLNGRSSDDPVDLAAWRNSSWVTKYTSNAGVNETRPKNIAIYYIIKYL